VHQVRRTQALSAQPTDSDVCGTSAGYAAWTIALRVSAPKRL
jgi:hypothetical protein